ncbi:ABC transporter permease [Streptomyces longwoodensis]|uniref:ABC transporter permease n=1 Tax=Streptomyces longwoodensis TaxID=68231 RepID=UPI00225482AB|nr:ABC transporter permease [Streptomyces longwoodensis]MCX4997088.1 ABC transporter permease [Streptomyces longwoodensis]WRY91739.1 ABC transporter permease [Streptomyces longwoodensis]WTI43970.1 ABC transporter permease [Streptomyces longwoodensis]WUC56745.1 ABC transporter permease [Streptomyces longwoodensis]
MSETLTPARLAAKHGLSVSGARPSVPAYVRRLWDRRHFILAFSSAKVAAQYSQARLGQLWQVATPLLNAAVYFMIFGLILGAGRGMPKDVYIPFLVTGVFVFTFTQSSVMSGVRAISGNLGLVRALHFPRAALPLSFCLQQLQQLLYSMIVLFLVVVGFGSYPDLSWALIVPVLALQFCFNSGLAMVLARAGAHTPDLAQLMPFVMRTWMYASGVMFSIPVFLADKPQWIANVLQWNPAALYMDLMRFALIEGYGAENLPDHVWAVAGGWAVLVALGGFLFFWQAEEKYGRG